MKTCCSNCKTTFRVTPEQLKARAGKVRCGQCQTVFNALDSLLDEPPPIAPAPPQVPPVDSPAAPDAPSQEAPDSPEADGVTEVDILLEADPAAEATVQPMSESAALELGKAAGLIFPRETTEIHGYSKWNEGVMAAAVVSPPEKAARWPFILAACLLFLVLAGQLAYRWRSEVVVTAPVLRPAFDVLCRVLGTDIPLPRHVDLISIEASDLQNDPAHGNLLVLTTTLRNQAGFGQAYPSLELSLTDTQDTAIVRRVFAPTEYLPARLSASQPFAANSDVAIRLWIEASEISAAGYRVYVFYP